MLLAIENQVAFGSPVRLGVLNAARLFPAQQEECGTFEPLQQPFSVLIVVSWQEVVVHWSRTSAGSLHKVRPVVLHAAIMQRI
jgi:hypothetical protein